MQSLSAPTGALRLPARRAVQASRAAPAASLPGCAPRACRARCARRRCTHAAREAAAPLQTRAAPVPKHFIALLRPRRAPACVARPARRGVPPAGADAALPCALCAACAARQEPPCAGGHAARCAPGPAPRSWLAALRVPRHLLAAAPQARARAAPRRAHVLRARAARATAQHERSGACRHVRCRVRAIPSKVRLTHVPTRCYCAPASSLRRAAQPRAAGGGRARHAARGRRPVGGAPRPRLRLICAHLYPPRARALTRAHVRLCDAAG
jgi:hypothetical protein